MTGAGWATEVSRTYPFHPALIRVLDKRLSTIPNFQRTRGALRLLARAVRDLWEKRPENAQLIHLHHLDLSDRVIANDCRAAWSDPSTNQSSARISHPRSAVRNPMLSKSMSA